MTSPVRLGVSLAAASTPKGFSIRGLRLYFPKLEPWVGQSVWLPPPFPPVYLCENVGPHGLLAAAWPALFHSPPPRWVQQLPHRRESSLPWLPISAPPAGLDECFFFNSLVVGLSYSSIFCQFWLFFVFKLLLSFFWLWEEAQCVYLRLHLGWKPTSIFNFLHSGCTSLQLVLYIFFFFYNTYQ